MVDSVERSRSSLVVKIVTLTVVAAFLSSTSLKRHYGRHDESIEQKDDKEFRRKVLLPPEVRQTVKTLFAVR